MENIKIEKINKKLEEYKKVEMPARIQNINDVTKARKEKRELIYKIEIDRINTNKDKLTHLYKINNSQKKKEDFDIGIKKITDVFDIRTKTAKENLEVALDLIERNHNRLMKFTEDKVSVLEAEIKLEEAKAATYKDSESRNLEVIIARQKLLVAKYQIDKNNSEEKALSKLIKKRRESVEKIENNETHAGELKIAEDNKYEKSITENRRYFEQTFEQYVLKIKDLEEKSLNENDAEAKSKIVKEIENIKSAMSSLEEHSKRAIENIEIKHKSRLSEIFESTRSKYNSFVELGEFAVEEYRSSLYEIEEKFNRRVSSLDAKIVEAATKAEKNNANIDAKSRKFIESTRQHIEQDSERFKFSIVIPLQKKIASIVIAIAWIAALALVTLTVVLPLTYGGFATAETVTGTINVLGGNYFVENYYQVNKIIYWLLPVLGGLWITGASYVTIMGIRFMRGTLSYEKFKHFYFASIVFSLVIMPLILRKITITINFRPKNSRFVIRNSAIIYSTIILLSITLVYVFLAIAFSRSATPNATIINSGVLSGDTITFNHNNTNYAIAMIVMLISTFMYTSTVLWITSIATGNVRSLVKPKRDQEEFETSTLLVQK